MDFQTVAGWILGGIFYDEVKVATSISYEKIKNLLPLKDEEIEAIEAELISDNTKQIKNKEMLYEYIIQNKNIQQILKELEKREPKKSKEIVNSFKKNKKIKLNLDLESVDTVKNSFNDNEDCEINVKI